ncbi:hypothetical protein Taro_027139 [Colocasia esculenta]|uniref:Retrotransposon gag domain-containing protein n=1 Tax=Colocasia esculenta TaxID=4460 RepID=A0A843V7Y1_COLES|nr:hypothetical protein [Colocasia esculenta]
MAVEEQPPATPQAAPVQPEVPPMVWQQTPVAMAAPEDLTALLERFLRLWPPMFYGDYDPDKVESWVHELERTFKTMDCTKQDQYHQRFVQLLRHIPHMATSEQARTKRFISALRSELRWAMADHLCDTLGLAVARATSLERECRFQPQQGGDLARSTPYQRPLGSRGSVSSSSSSGIGAVPPTQQAQHLQQHQGQFQQPQQRQQHQQQPHQGCGHDRVMNITREEAEASNLIVGTVPILGQLGQVSTPDNVKATWQASRSSCQVCELDTWRFYWSGCFTLVLVLGFFFPVWSFSDVVWLTLLVVVIASLTCGHLNLCLWSRQCPCRDQIATGSLLPSNQVATDLVSPSGGDSLCITFSDREGTGDLFGDPFHCDSVFLAPVLFLARSYFSLSPGETSQQHPSRQAEETGP